MAGAARPLPFGRHKGQALRDVPPAYLDLLVARDDLRPLESAIEANIARCETGAPDAAAAAPTLQRLDLAGRRQEFVEHQVQAPPDACGTRRRRDTPRREHGSLGHTLAALLAVADTPPASEARQ
jgi:hypothetical protein